MTRRYRYLGSVIHQGVIYSRLVDFRPLLLGLHVLIAVRSAPVVVWIHGDGFRSGDRRSLPRTVRPNAAFDVLTGTGLARAIIDYRLAGEAIWPAQCDDVNAAIEFITTYADLWLFFAWCADQHPAPLTAQRVQIERYVRWMQEVRRFKPSTVSRCMAVVTGFYRTCVIDAVLEHSPADYVRLPVVPPESPTLGLSHLQFEALLTAARESTNVFVFALVTMLGLLGLRIFETCGADITDVGE